MLAWIDEHRILSAALAVLALAGGFALSYLDAPRTPEAAAPPIEGPSYTRIGLPETPSGVEIVAVYIGADGCAWSNHEGLPEAVKRMKSLLADEAESRGLAFASLGVALDWSVDAGLEHLEKFGYFDQVTAGRNWLNIAAFRYIWEEVPGEGATPQVVVVKRRVEGPDDRDPRARYSASEPRLMIRKVGFDEITAWVEQGAPLPETAMAGGSDAGG